MEELPIELIYKILSYVNYKDVSCVCSLWRNIVNDKRRREYINKVISSSGESREFVEKNYEDYLNNWC